jgi:hypothetical protein
MGSRERKRAELQRRKQRATQSHPVGTSPETGAPAPEAPAAAPVSRTEQKNREARDALVPLAEGERPLIVTIGAVISALLALSVIVGYAAGLKVDGEKANVVQVVVPVGLMGLMAWGMWRARYWAVLGFQTVMLILVLVCSLSLVTATSVVQALANAVVAAIAGTLFYFMVKALARIQMPSTTPRR